MTLSNRGWKRETRGPPVTRARVRTPHKSRVFTPGRIVFLLVLLVVIVLMLPRHITIGGHRLHPGFAPYLTPYLLG